MEIGTLIKTEVGMLVEYSKLVTEYFDSSDCTFARPVRQTKHYPIIPTDKVLKTGEPVIFIIERFNNIEYAKIIK